jgi:DNA repair photolyase
MEQSAIEYVPAKSIVYSDKKGYSWFGGEYKMNIYRGCCHGCIYCDSRSDCYQIEDFGKVRAKADALAIIRDDLRRKVKPGVVMSGASSDPYNSFEKDLELTRHALELINAYGFGVGLSTKSPLVTRDGDVLTEIAEHSPVIVKLTVTCADDNLCKKIEPGVAPTSERFAAIEELTRKGIYCGILMMPILPGLTDTEENILTIVRRAKEVGARFIYPSFGLSMRSGQREYMYSQFDTLFPGLREIYDARYGSQYGCPSPKAKTLSAAFRKACDEAGILYKMPEIIRSSRMGYEGTQLSFF